MPTADFLPAHEITLVRGEPNPVSDVHEAAVAAHWSTAVDSNPTLFNGPIANPLSAAVSEGRCTVRWHHSDFAHYLHTRANPDDSGTVPVATLFVSIALPTTDRRLVAGRMSRRTSTPGVIQLPGGGISIRPDEEHLSQHDLTATAVLEAGEELGISLDPTELRICGVITRQRPPDIGVVFTAQPRPWENIREKFNALRARELQLSVEPEFDRVLAISADADLTDSAHGGQVIDYLPSVVAALLTTGART